MSAIGYRTRQGFTLVELVIVIAVISILAAITIIGYSGVQEEARLESLQVDLAAAAKQMELARENGTYPSTLPEDVKASSGNVLQLSTISSSDDFCINGYNADGVMMSYSSSDGPREYLCNGAGTGNTVGGSVPIAPRGVNLVSDFSTWELNGGVTYDSSSNEIHLNSANGNATSPLVKVDSPTRCKFEVEMYATESSPTAGTGKSQVYVGSRYYAADGTTPVENSIGYTGNGNAGSYSLDQWNTHTWSTACGANVKYVQFVLHSAPTSRTSDNRYRNPQIMAID